MHQSINELRVGVSEKLKCIPGIVTTKENGVDGASVFVPKTDIRWRDLLAQLGCGSGVSRWRRLRDWGGRNLVRTLPVERDPVSSIKSPPTPTERRSRQS
ncbi:Transposase [Mycetohabitans rhizoxinica HKI 454]|uniref:Transposase n=1 Tax=Mycetohabitans rhizoxinica (strain DSM 19002 / CIP 109453 / HKI 454) TaxID=882378 RepID=E5ARP4_MYCRK|nr:Transposase [Mycetohabitans rhizoxinica HKI 454]